MSDIIKRKSYEVVVGEYEIFLNKWVVVLKNGIDILTIFGEKRERFGEYMEFLFDVTLSQVENDEIGVMPIVYDAKSKNYAVDFSWFIYVMAKWIAHENESVDEETMRKFLVHYLLTSKEEYTASPRFFVIGLLGLHFDILGMKIAIGNRDYARNSGPYPYKKSAYTLKLLYEYGDGKLVLFDAISLDYYKIKRIFKLDFADDLAELQNEKGVKQVAFLHHDVEKYLAGRKPEKVIRI